MKSARKRLLVTADQLNQIEKRKSSRRDDSDDENDGHYDPNVNPYYIPHPSAKVARTSGRNARARYSPAIRYPNSTRRYCTLKNCLNTYKVLATRSPFPK
jgi:hypothetical protein